MELADGEVLVIGGLLMEEEEKIHTRIPVLGHIPILGYLFKSEEFRQNRTELLVLVTPRLSENSEVFPWASVAMATIRSPGKTGLPSSVTFFWPGAV